MNSKSTVITSLVILAAGITLVMLHSRPDILHSIIFVSGMALIIPGLVNIILLLSHRDSTQHRPTATMRVVGWISSVAAVALGVIMVVTPDSFIPILVYLFGGVMTVSALGLIYAIARAIKGGKMPAWTYIGPVLVLIAGVVMLCMGHDSMTPDVITLVTGIAMIVFAVSWYLAMGVLAGHNHKMRKQAKLAAQSSETEKPAEVEPAKAVEAPHSEDSIH